MFIVKNRVQYRMADQYRPASDVITQLLNIAWVERNHMGRKEILTDTNYTTIQNQKSSKEN